MVKDWMTRFQDSKRKRAQLALALAEQSINGYYYFFILFTSII
jgi:hypothetical protein